MQEESFTGVMAWMFAPGLPLGKLTKGKFEGFNKDLKQAAEAEAKGGEGGGVSGGTA